ncbi:MAG: methylated-DNA--[protein]-cysteine S-methyltransferase [Micrococcales bacterium]
MKTPLYDSSLCFDSPIGKITVRANQNKITEVTISDGETFGESKILNKAKKQLLKMLDGKAVTFDLDYELAGTDFQLAVWNAIAKVPFGETTTYSELAIQAGNPKAVRAVGGAVGANPIPLIFGCHRVLGANDKITGYSGGSGLATKRQLLAIEKISYRE